MAAQKPVGCFICGDVLAESKGVHVDHDHRTNEIRGLLCQGCNKGLGMFRDDPMLLIRAANYLVPDGISFLDIEHAARTSAMERAA